MKNQAHAGVQNVMLNAMLNVMAQHGIQKLPPVS